MERVPAMVSMRRTPAEKEEIEENFLPGPGDIPDYPYGLSISLCIDELERLGLEDENFEPGDYVHMHCMAVVTSVSKNANQDGSSTRIELQIVAISAEDEEEEDEENEEEEDAPSKLYKLA